MLGCCYSSCHAESHPVRSVQAHLQLPVSPFRSGSTTSPSLILSPLHGSGTPSPQPLQQWNLVQTGGVAAIGGVSTLGLLADPSIDLVVGGIYMPVSGVPLEQWILFCYNKVVHTSAVLKAKYTAIVMGSWDSHRQIGMESHTYYMEMTGFRARDLYVCQEINSQTK